MNPPFGDDMKFATDLARVRFETMARKARMSSTGSPLAQSLSKVRKGIGVTPLGGLLPRSSGPSPSAVARTSEAGSLLKQLASLVQEVVVEVAGETRTQVTHGLRVGTSALSPPGVITVGRVPRGRFTDVPMVVENTTGAAVSGLRFLSSPLVAPGRDPIPADAVMVGPDPVDVEAGGVCRLIVTVTVPPHAAPGRFVGSLEAEGPPRVQATVTVDVV